MRKTKAIIALIVLLLATVLGSVNVHAVTAAQMTGDDGKITVTRNISGVTSAVTNTFTYTVTEDTENPETGLTGVPSSLTITFNNTTPTSGKATATTQLDLTGVSFSKLGDYKFKIEETASSNATDYPVDANKVYYVYVSVRNEVDSNDVPTGALEATLATQAKINDTGDKKDIVYESSSKSYITITNNLTGNLADTEEYFKIKVDIDGTAGDTYTISGQDTSVTYDGSTVTPSTTYTVGQDNYVYLKHGQTVTIGLNGTTKEITAGTEYSVTEQAATDYETYIDGSTTNSKASATKTLSNDATSTDNKVAVVNHKESPTLTGVFLNILPFVVLVVLAIIGIIIIRKSSKKKED